MGTQTVTVHAEEIEGSGQTIRMSAYAGFGIIAALYLVFNFAVVWGLPSSELAGSSTPIAIAARRILGPWGETMVVFGAMISAMGVLNGWILVSGRLPYAAARDGLAPASLARINERTGTPILALVVSSLVPALFLFLFFNQTLLQAYNFIALASTAMALVVLGVSCGAQMALLRREPQCFTERQRRHGDAWAILSLAFVVLMLAGVGWTAIILTSATVVGLMPYYWWIRRQAARDAGVTALRSAP
jgi:APA family basic amino acid/polyamine antiporter